MMNKPVLYLLCLVSGGNLLGADLAKPGQFLTRPGTYRFTNDTLITALTLQTNVLKIESQTPASKATAAAASWQTGPGWFVYVGKDRRVWAFDGDQGCWLLSATALGATVKPMEKVTEAPPAAVAKRLPKTLREALPQAKP